MYMFSANDANVALNEWLKYFTTLLSDTVPMQWEIVDAVTLNTKK